MSPPIPNAQAQEVQSIVAPSGNTLTPSRMRSLVLLLVVINLIWAGQPTAIKYIPSDQLGPFAIAFLPLYFVTPLLMPLLWWRGSANRDSPRPSGSDWMHFIIAGIGGQLVAQLGMTWGSVVGQASSCVILYLLIPVVTAAMASLVLREHLTRLRAMCLALGLAGVLLMSAKDLGTASLLQSDYLLGNILFLGGCIGASFYNVYCKRLMTKFYERDVLIYSYMTAAFTSLPILLWQEPECISNLAYLSVSGWIAFAFLVLLVYGLSMLMFFHVLHYLPATIALTSTYLVPVFGVVIAMVLLGEQLNAATIVGAVVVLSSTMLIMKFEAPSPSDPAGDSAYATESFK